MQPTANELYLLDVLLSQLRSSDYAERVKTLANYDQALLLQLLDRLPDSETVTDEGERELLGFDIAAEQGAKPFRALAAQIPASYKAQSIDTDGASRNGKRYVRRAVFNVELIDEYLGGGTVQGEVLYNAPWQQGIADCRWYVRKSFESIAEIGDGQAWELHSSTR